MKHSPELESLRQRLATYLARDEQGSFLAAVRRRAEDQLRPRSKDGKFRTERNCCAGHGHDYAFHSDICCVLWWCVRDFRKRISARPGSLSPQPGRECRAHFDSHPAGSPGRGILHPHRSFSRSAFAIGRGWFVPAVRGDRDYSSDLGCDYAATPAGAELATSSFIYSPGK